VGVHPENEGIQEPTVEDLVKRAHHPRVVAIGETGLDYFWGMENRTIDDMQWQRDRFRVHLQAAVQCDLPVVIHTRSASNDTLRILQDEWLHSGKRLKGVFHCFTESEEVARAALDLGFYISFSGILTFKNASDLRNVAQTVVPLDRMLIETDSPYLAPVPHRGKTNTPAWVVHVAQQLATLKDVKVEDVAQITTQNFFDLFAKTRQ
jgi:TatD DNase family protein